MSKTDAKFTLTAFDKTSAVLNRIDKRMSRFGNKMKSVGKSMSVALTLPATLLAGSSLKAYDVQEKALAKVQNAIRSTGNAAKISFAEFQTEASRLQGKSLFGVRKGVQD